MTSDNKSVPENAASDKAVVVLDTTDEISVVTLKQLLPDCILYAAICGLPVQVFGKGAILNEWRARRYPEGLIWLQGTVIVIDDTGEYLPPKTILVSTREYIPELEAKHPSLRRIYTYMTDAEKYEALGA